MKNPILNPEKYAAGVHVIGAPGSGKSKLLQEVARQFVASEQGLLRSADPHAAPYDELIVMIRRAPSKTTRKGKPKNRS